MSERRSRRDITVIRYQNSGDCGESLCAWFANAKEIAWKSSWPVYVLVPQYSVSAWIKRKLLDNGQSFFGVRFITPRDARYLLARRLWGPDKICADAEMDLLAASVALSQEDDPKSRAIAADPSIFRDLLETLTPTGHNLSEIFKRYGLNRNYQHFQKALKRANGVTPWEADRRFLEEATDEIWMSSLLVFGFHGGHWPLRHLLQAFLTGAQTSNLYLEEPRMDDEGAQLDRAWIDTWEEFSGRSENLLLSSDTKKSFKEFFIVGRDARDQASGITATVAEWLREGAERIGVLVPQKGFLSDEISRAFLRCGFSFFDGIGSLVYGGAENTAWRAWLEFQRKPSLATCLFFLKEREEVTEEIEREFDRAWRSVLSDDLDVILRWLVQEHRGLKISLTLLPKKATLEEMSVRTEDAFRVLGWESRVTRIRSRLHLLSGNLNLKTDRRSWCRWLAAVLDDSFREREQNAAEPYARLHVLTYEAALSQQWSHLFFAGMNEGAEPGSDVSFPFLDAEDAGRFNTEIRRRNKSTVRTGSRGMGVEIVPDGHAYCLGSEERRQIGRRMLVALKESATVACGYSASVYSEAKASLQLRPSNFFADAWLENKKSVLSDGEFRALAERSRNVLAELFPSKPHQKIELVAKARAARVNASRAFGRYEFAFENASAPAKAILSCDAWEKAYKDPAPKWLQYYLGVKPSPAFEEVPWNMVVGEWTHWWMDKIHSGKTRWEILPDAQERLSRIRSAASEFRKKITRIYAEAEKTLPFWWEEALKQSLSVAFNFNAKLDALPQGWKFATEYPVSHSIAVNSETTEFLQLNGRIDFIAADTVEEERLESSTKVAIADYKTGRSKPLSVASLKKEEGIQVALYAMLIRSLGIPEVGAGYLVAEHPYVPRQIASEDLDQIRGLLSVLATMQNTGIFGMRREVRSEYAHVAPMPMATLRVTEDILRAKWKLSHKENSDE